MEHFINGFKKFAEFEGRERRQAYWMFTLFYIIFALVTGFLDGMIGSDGAISVIYALVMLLPSFSYMIRRLHDTGRSGWFFLLSLIPLVGSIILLVFLCQDSDADNQYGVNPKS